MSAAGTFNQSTHRISSIMREDQGVKPMNPMILETASRLDSNAGLAKTTVEILFYAACECADRELIGKEAMA
jgi:hypothetical protein